VTLETNQRFIKIGFIAILLMIPTYYLLEQMQLSKDASMFQSKLLKFIWFIEVMCAVFLLGIYGWLARFQSSMSRGYYNALDAKEDLHWDEKRAYRKLKFSKFLGIWVEQSDSSKMKHEDKK